MAPSPPKHSRNSSGGSGPGGGRSGSVQVLDRGSAERLAALFSALADPTRVRLLSLILDREMCVHELAAALQMTQSAVSHQLRIMRNLRLVRHRKQGRHAFYQLDDEHVRELFERASEHVAESGQQAGRRARQQAGRRARQQAGRRARPKPRRRGT